jgi:hypothetical protein
MEVHHHPNVEKKSFKEYFLEFLMIFLAVTLGFIAENVREHFAENKTVTELLKNYKEELTDQQSTFQRREKIFSIKLLYCDSAKQIIYNEQENQKLSTIEHLFNNLAGLNLVQINTSAYDQMVSSGSLRYITNTRLLNLMGQYRMDIESNKNYNISMTQAELNIEPEVSKIQDFHNFIHEDTTWLPNNSGYVFPIRPFGKMTREQRGLMIWYYELFYIQNSSNLYHVKELIQTNRALIEMVEKELSKH